MLRKISLTNLIIPALIFIIGAEVSGGALKIISLTIGDRIQEKKPIERKQETQKKIAQTNGYNPDNISFLWENGILGKDVPKEQPKPVEPEQIQPIISPLSDTYRLVGTIVGRTQKYAFLAPRAGGNIIVKKQGEEIMPGAIISSIKDDMIEITRGNIKELIFLFEKDKEKFAQQQQRTPEVSLPQNPGIPSFANLPMQQESRPDLRQVGENTFEIRREYVQSSLSDIGALLTNARAIPYIKDGEIKGFRLVNISPGSFYKTIGIQDGDVIKNINGVPISNPQTIMKIFTDIQNETQFEIKIERMGKEMTLRYYIR